MSSSQNTDLSLTAAVHFMKYRATGQKIGRDAAKAYIARQKENLNARANSDKSPLGPDGAELKLEKHALESLEKIVKQLERDLKASDSEIDRLRNDGADYRVDDTIDYQTSMSSGHYDGYEFEENYVQRENSQLQDEEKKRNDIQRELERAMDLREERKHRIVQLNSSKWKGKGKA